MSDPFRIEVPTCISFSGGRTSAYMLWRVLQSNGGLPDIAKVCFGNTGKEMPATLDFVEKCARKWNIDITWLEFRPKTDAGFQYAVVDYKTASRNGEPFEMLIKEKAYVPNAVHRFCTTFLKLRPMDRYLRDCGFDEYDAFIGIRADERRRASKISARGTSKENSNQTMVMPLVEAGITVKEVSEFWEKSDFDLGLKTIKGRALHGNCDLCFLKGYSQVKSLIAEDPSRATWWARMEEYATSVNGDRHTLTRFRSDRASYAEMAANASNQGDFYGHEEPIECFCGE